MSMPMGLLNAYLEMLPKLEAEESINGASRVSVAWGGEGARKILDGWRQQVDGGAGGRRAKPAHPGDLARMGISFVVVQTAAPPEGAHG